MPPPPKKGVKATLHKLFILDAQGGYAGEVPLDENCVVEFSDFLAAIPEAGIADGQTIFLGEWKATAINGERMSLVAISKGSLGPEEVAWAKGALVAAEAQLTQPETEETPVSHEAPDKGVMENLASALDKRGAALAEREKAIADAEQRAQTAWEEYRKQFEAELDGIRAKAQALEQERDAAKQELQVAQEKIRREMDRIANAPRAIAPAQPDPRLEQMRKQNEQDRKYLQKYALELIAREEKARDAATAAAESLEKLAIAQAEIDALRAELAAVKTEAAQPSPELEASRREIEMRVKILQEKAFDLLQREEKLRAREQKLQETLKHISA